MRTGESAIDCGGDLAMPKDKKDGEEGVGAEPGWPVVGFDLGGTKMYAVVFGDGWEVLGAERRPTNGHEGAEAGVVRMADAIGAALVAAGVARGDLRAIGIGCPGIVDMRSGTLHSAPNLGWDEVPLRGELGGRFGCPVAVVNDVDAGTYGEFVAGAGRGARTLVGVSPGTGVGAGCVYDGALLRGRRYSCMEIGRVRWPVPSVIGEPGEWPNFESFCSRLAVASACAAEAFRGNAPVVMEKAGTDMAKIKSKVIAAAYAAGDPGVVNIIDRAIEYLTGGVAAVVNLLAPDRVVLGGGLVEAMPKVFVDGMAKRLADFTAAELLEELVVCAAELGDEATAIGAAALAVPLGK
jgi:glucokinase